MCIVHIDPRNPVVVLCAAGMAVEGDVSAAQRLFEQAWEARTDDYDASIAAHFLARVQPTAALRREWNATAARHAEAVTDGRARGFMASLYLNLADAQLACGDVRTARITATLAESSVLDLPEDGYRGFVALGIERLRRRLDEAGTTV